MAAAATKKRVAADDDGNTHKRLKSEKKITSKVSKGAETKSSTRKQNAPVQKKSQQRKLPLTSAENDEPEATSDEEDYTEDVDDEMEDQPADEELPSDEEMQDVPKDTQKTNPNAQASRKAQKALLSERRAAKQHSDILTNAKRLWASARRKEAPKDERSRDVAALLAAIRGKVQDVVLKHDASRIVQTIVKYGTQQERDEVARELKGKYRELSQNKYSKFLVTKLIRTCPRQRTEILSEFRGHVIRLLLHREASSVIADAFELYTNAHERSLLLHDFYGKEVILFSPALTKGAAADQEERAELRRGLSGALEGADQEKRKRILTAMKENLELVLNNSDKGAVSHAIFHRALWEYLSQVSEIEDEEVQEKMRRSVFEGCQELFAEMVHTKDGSRLVREFIVRGTAKDRKQILKILKPHIERICKDDEAQLVLFTSLDVIDDTKLTSKSIVGEITSKATALYTSAQGRRSLLYLLVPRSPRHFMPAVIAQLAETDKIRSQTSKKDATVRAAEVLQAASGPLLALLSTSKSLEEIIRDPGGSILVLETMLYAEGDKTEAMKSLLSLLQQPYPSSGESPHLIDVPHSCRVYKTLLQGGHYSQRDKQIERVPDSVFSPSTFASMWLSTLNREQIHAFGKGGGAFVVAALIERIFQDGAAEDKATITTWFDSDYRKEIEEGQTKGKQILVDTFKMITT